MFVCRVCTRRTSTNLLRRLPAETRQTAALRTFTTSSISRQVPSSDLQNLSSDWGELDAVAANEEPKAKESFHHGERAIEKQKALEKLKRATKKELQYTTDPYHIAENVAKKLEEKDFEKALIMTREASKDKQVVVSWNHLIAYELKNQKLGAAIKLYNEVCLPSFPIFTARFLLGHAWMLKNDPDEKARPITQCADLHHHLQRLRRVKTPPAGCQRSL